MADVGPDWEKEFPDYAARTKGSQLHEVSGGFPSERVNQTKQVRHDDQGRELADCGCLKRQPAPPPPSSPPFPILPENVGKIRDWILEYYAASSFNICPHQPLPLMTGQPPLRIHVREGTEPVAVHRPSTIPAHWLDQVKAELERDIALGVLERVPSNTPTTWCSRMHVVGKKTGEPRRVVDLRPLNAATARQTHTTEPPFR